MHVLGYFELSKKLFYNGCTQAIITAILWTSEFETPKRML